jgi:hypothetical protein
MAQTLASLTFAAFIALAIALCAALPFAYAMDAVRAGLL